MLVLVSGKSMNNSITTHAQFPNMLIFNRFCNLFAKKETMISKQEHNERPTLLPQLQKLE